MGAEFAKTVFDDVKARLHEHPLLTAEDLAKATGGEYEKPLCRMPKVAHLRMLGDAERGPPVCDLPTRRGWELRSDGGLRVSEVVGAMITAAAYNASRARGPHEHVDVLMQLSMSYWMQGAVCIMSIVDSSSVVSYPSA